MALYITFGFTLERRRRSFICRMIPIFMHKVYVGMLQSGGGCGQRLPNLGESLSSPILGGSRLKDADCLHRYREEAFLALSAQLMPS